MTTLQRHSERFAASGGMGARTARRALGTPRVAFWDMFVRETIQNSSDARLDDHIRYRIDGWYATPVQRQILRDTVFADLPPGSRLAAELGSTDLGMLLVSDSGTRGLSGPTRADVHHAGRTDFVDFVRDTGRRADKGFAGGTYGFGKAVLPTASAAATIVIFTRTGRRADISRLIAMAVDEEYTDRSLRYTGRHWWGRLRDNVAEPVEGPEADRLAALLGMDTALTGATGTAVLVLAPRTPPGLDGPRSIGNILAELPRAAIEYAWPHTIPDDDGRPSIAFEFTWNGRPLPVPDVQTDDRLRAFTDAYRHCHDLLGGTQEPGEQWPWTFRFVTSQRPKRRLGALAWRTYGAVGPQHATNARAEIALIRTPGFVVSYRQITAHPSGQSTAGAFLADLDLDHDFAEAEPPTHDEWVPVKGRYGDPVRMTIKGIDAATTPRLLGTTSTTGAATPGIVRVSSILGQIFDGVAAGGDPRIARTPTSLWDSAGAALAAADGGVPPRPDGAGPAAQPPGGVAGDGTGGVHPPGDADPTTATSGTGGSGAAGAGGDHLPGGTGPQPAAPAPVYRGRRARVTPDGPPRLLLHDGRRAAEFPFTVRVPATAGEVLVQARPDVLVDTGREAEPPTGAPTPQILGWRDLTFDTVHREADLPVTEPGTTRWSVIVSQPDDTAVGVTLTVAGPA